MPRFSVVTVFAILVCAAPSALAAGAADQLSADGAYVRLPPPGAKNTGAFMVLRNKGATPLKLVKASNPASKVTELHAHLNEGGVMKMRQVPFIEVPAKGEAILKPGSLHVMLIDVIQPLKEGEQIVLTLGLEDGTSLAVPAPVRRPDLGVVPDAGTAAAAAHHPH